MVPPEMEAMQKDHLHTCQGPQASHWPGGPACHFLVPQCQSPAREPCPRTAHMACPTAPSLASVSSLLPLARPPASHLTPSSGPLCPSSCLPPDPLEWSAHWLPQSHTTWRPVDRVPLRSARGLQDSWSCLLRTRDPGCPCRPRPGVGKEPREAGEPLAVGGVRTRKL